MLRIDGEELPYLPVWWPTALALDDDHVFDGFGAVTLSGIGNWLGRIGMRA